MPLTKAEWKKLEPKLRFRAFTVAKLGTAEEIEKAKQILIRALKDGETYASTWQTVKETLNSKGTLKPNYWETVFRTNTQSAYIAGKLQKYQETNVKAFQLMVIEDSRTSPFCRSLLDKTTGYGMILPVNHQFWKTYGFPPYHFNCRTSISPVYGSMIGKAGYIVEDIPMKHFSKFKPQKGFGGNPLEKESFWKMTTSMIKKAEKFGIMADIVSFAHKLGMKSYFPELLKGFETVYINKKGGYIQKAKIWKYSEHEMSVAKRLFEDNHKVYLLPRTNKAKSPDMLIDGELGDIKECSSLSSVDSRLRDAIHQECSVAALDIITDLPEKEIRETIQNRLERTSNKIQKIFVLLNGRIFKL